MNKNANALGTHKISKLLLQMSLPATIGMLVNALYNIVSTIYVGHGIGPEAIGGLTIIFPIQMILMGFAQMIGFGGAALISIKLGEKNKESADQIAGNAFTTTFILSLAFVIIGLFFTDPLLRIFGASESLLPYAHDYLKIILLGSCFFTFIMSANAMVRAEGNAMMAMMTMVLGIGLDIVISPIFIYVLKWGVKGAAIATVISQFVSFLFMIRYLFFGSSALKVRASHLVPNLDIIKDIVSIGMPAFVRSAGASIIGVIMNFSLFTYGGDSAIIYYGIINRVTMMIFMPLFGVAQGLQPIAGFNYGARNFDRVQEVFKLSNIISISIATFGWIFCMFTPELLLRIFTTDPGIISSGSFALRMFAIMMPLVASQIVIATLFQSLNKAKPSMALSLLRQYIILIPLVLLLPNFHSLGEFGIWISFPISDAISTAVSFVMYFSIMKGVKLDFSRGVASGSSIEAGASSSETLVFAEAE
jgi:putative MATE family efflux protein